MTFLGLLDFLYDLHHGTFSDRFSAARLAASVVGSALVLGPATTVRLWKGPGSTHRLRRRITSGS
jgi:hypothetical protein